jgi:hypothetical protein
MAIVYESIYSVDLPLDNDKKKYENETQTKRIVQKEIPWHRRQTPKKEIPEHMKPYTHVCNEECDICPETCGLPSRLFKSKCPFIVEKKGDMCRFHQSCKTCHVCLEIITSKKNEFITTCGHSYHKKCRHEYEIKMYRRNKHAYPMKCHTCDKELVELFPRRKHRTKKNKDLKTEIDISIIENENQTFFDKHIYSVQESLYNFLQYVFLTV